MERTLVAFNSDYKIWKVQSATEVFYNCTNSKNKEKFSGGDCTFSGLIQLKGIDIYSLKFTDQFKHYQKVGYND